MISLTFTKDSAGRLVQYEVSGHSNNGAICAGLSCVSQGMALVLMRHNWGTCESQIEGYFRFKINDVDNCPAIVVELLEESAMDLARQYPLEVTVDYKEV